MNSTEVKIRPAESKDAQQMATLFMRCWQISLKDFTPPGFIDQFSPEVQKQKYLERLTDPRWTMFVVESDNRIIGMIAGKNNSAEPLAYEKEIRAMYVDPDFQKQGIGSLLFKELFSDFQKRQVRNAMLWCIKANYPACSFYEKHGGCKIENIKPRPEYSSMLHVIYTWEFLQ